MRIRAMKKQSQNKPNFRKAAMFVNFYLTKDYENVPLRRRGENKPNQTQFQTRCEKSFELVEEIKALILYGLGELGGTGLEPVTSCVSSRRSNQLS